jgi:hypothetical protein
MKLMVSIRKMRSGFEAAFEGATGEAEALES